MKKIALLAVKESVFVPQLGRYEELEFKTTDAIEMAVNTPPHGGFQQLADIETRLTIRGKLKDLPTDATELELEDSEFDKLKECVNASSGAVLSSFIRDFRKQFA